MLSRFAITSLLGFALLFSQGGLLLVAALCPHLRFSSPICDVPKMMATMDHSQMDHHDMDRDASALPITANSKAVGEAIGHGDEPCSHCAVHSRSDSNAAFIRTADTSKPSADLDISDSVAALPPVPPVSVAVLTLRDHGPPGKASRPKHILINTFRI